MPKRAFTRLPSARQSHRFDSDDLDYLITAATPCHTVTDVLESLHRDTTLPRVTDLVFQFTRLIRHTNWCSARSGSRHRQRNSAGRAPTSPPAPRVVR